MIYLWLLRLLTDGSHNRNGGTPFIVVCLAKGVLGYNTLVEKGSQLIFNQVDPMLVVFVHGLEVGLHQLLDLVFDVGVFEAEIIIQVLLLLVHLAEAIILIVNFLSKGSDLIAKTLLDNLFSLQYFSHALPLFLALDLLVEHLQLGEHNGLDVLETLEETLLSFFLPLGSEPDVILDLVDLQLQSMHLLLVPLYLGDVVLFKRLQ